MKDLSLTPWPADLSTATPPAIDTVFADLHGVLSDLHDRKARTFDSLHHAAGDKRKGSRSYSWWAMSDDDAATAVQNALAGMTPWDRRSAEQSLARLVELNSAIAQVRAALEPGEAEWDRRNGWTRFYIVPGGHIHSSTRCHSLKPTTRIGWLPELSGRDEAAAVAEHGALLCTHCYPSAPVEWTNKLELDAAAKAASNCPGSKTYRYDRKTARTGYMSGNAGTCEECGGRITLTSTGLLRSHKADGGK